MTDIRIKNAVLHVLDGNLGMPILSNHLLDLNEELEDFLEKHISKLFMSDDCKNCEFSADSNFQNDFLDNQNDFILFSHMVSDRFYSIMSRNVDIPNGDLVILQISINHEDYVAVLKMNYKEAFVHFLIGERGDLNNTIIKHKTILPTAQNKVEEAFFINLSNKSIKLIEKMYEIDGVKSYYISSYILKCTHSLSEKQKLATVKKVMKELDKRYNKDSSSDMVVASTIFENIDENEEVYVADIYNAIYKDSAQMKKEATTILRDQGIESSEKIRISNTAVKKLCKQSLKASSGIEIKIPVNIYNSQESLEFINNPDGSISLLVKNIIL